MRSRLLAILFIFLASATLAAACGVGVINTPSGWDYGADSAEQSFIDYADGIEKLTISRNFESTESSTVWIIPIPAHPQKIKTDILTKLPELRGMNIADTANHHFKTVRRTLLKSQLYPLIPYFILDSTFGVSTSDFTIPSPNYSSGMISSASGGPAVTVYDHLEKEGMIAEVLTADNSTVLYDYLKNKQLDIPLGSITVLEKYIGPNFSFVASWVSPSTKPITTSNTMYLSPNLFSSTDRDAPNKGIQITFPTTKIFYPLHPGSVYPCTGLPETITIAGHVTPNLFKDIQRYTTTDYFDKPYFYDSIGSPLPYTKYTRVTVTAPPKALTEDLYITTTIPVKVQLLQVFNYHPTIGLFFTLILTAFLSAVITNLIIFRKKIFWPNVFALAFGNCFTLIGTVLAVKYFYKSRQLSLVIINTCLFSLLTLIASLALLIFTFTLT